MFSTFPYKAIKYQFSSDLPLITLTGIGFQNITDHSYSWHNLHRHDKHCLIQYCISGQGILTINNSTYTITAVDILPMPKCRGFLDTNDTCLLK